MGAKPLVRPAAKLYDEDFVLWTAEAARLLREGRFAEIDVEHVAEEIEDMGKRDHRERFSRLTLIIQHLLKWQYQPDRRSGSWKATVATQRGELEELFEQSPSLRRLPDRTLVRAYGIAIVAAAGETGLPEDSFPSKCPYTLEQILDRKFLPGR
jgi:hypothetical protein